MANMNVEARLERILRDLEAVGKHVQMYSGVSKEKADSVDRVATGIAEMAVRIAAEARKAQGDRSASGLVKKVRKALGFTYP